jgi:VanZ family protein
MTRPTPPPSSPPRLLPLGLWGVWLLTLGLWTACLLTTAPAHATAEVLAPEPDYIVTNAGHVLAYAVLAGALVWLPGRKKGWAVVLLSLHAIGTEVGQQWVPERTADLFDVGLDHLGIAGGLLLAWWLARRGKGAQGILHRLLRSGISEKACRPSPQEGAPRLRPSEEGAGPAGGIAPLSR